MIHIAGNSLLLPGPPSVVRPLPPRSSHRRRSLIFLYNSSCRFSHAAAAPPLGIPCGIPRCSVRFPPVFLRKTTPFSGHLPSGRPKTAGKISPGVPSVHLSFSSHGRLRRRVQPYGFTRFAFHHFQQNRPRFFLELRRVFQDFHGTARNPSPAPPSYTLYDLLDFHLRCHAFCQFAAVAVFIAGTVHHGFLDFCWIFFRSNGAVQRFFSCGCVPFSRRFYGKKFPFKIQSPKLVFVRRTFLSPFHPVSVVMSYPTCENHRFFR